MQDNSERRENTKKIAAWFLGPKAENAELEEKMISYILQDYFHWRRNYYPSDEIIIAQSMRREALDFSDQLAQKIAEMLAGLRRHFPFYSPRYMAHMMSDQTLPSVLGYFAALLYNPNNVAPEAAPVTEQWELEVGRDILELLGYRASPPLGAAEPARTEFGWAHVTSGGTIANLEALWAARNARYFPLAALRVVQKLDLDVPLPSSDRQPVRNFKDLDDGACLGLTPVEALHLLPALIDAIGERFRLARAEAESKMFELLGATGLSVPHNGTSACFAQWPPAIFVSGAAHYSISKSANVLGMGSENVILVDVDGLFRMDMRDLAAKLSDALRRGLFPLAVVGIAGTTEEGAVDPIHEIVELRQAMQSQQNAGFWLHIDAAWGGYLRSLFIPGENDAREIHSLDEHLENIHRFVSRDLHLSDRAYSRVIPMQWGSVDVCSAFLAIPKADSVTVDPHKMGYVPYPCGVVAFKSDRIRRFVAEDAPYLTSVVRESRNEAPPRSVGPYILEGSKPGAAVAGCWLSHRMIPLNRDGYGEIARASILAARELYERLVHSEHAAKANRTEVSFEFLPLGSQPPDTNIVCFLVRERGARSLVDMNALNRWIYQQFTIDAESSAGEYSYSHPFFLSHTVIRYPNYPERSVAGPLGRFEIDASEYREHGLFVLRATVMTPYIVLAEESGARRPYLAQFVERLAGSAEAGIAKQALGRVSASSTR
ncbi:MAG TPA: pyridoxal-dependent decarboxylase [Bryobacteraceae bacterium]|nr:pyridoxal-dependent decarboxylase [Bryobacteraceae bacterium]